MISFSLLASLLANPVSFVTASRGVPTNLNALSTHLGFIKSRNFDLYTTKSLNIYPLCLLLGLHDLTTFLKLLF